MEASRNTTDAYCELHFGKNEVYKTKTIYNNLEPTWDDAIFTYENIDDEDLQETSLEINVIDEDVISSDDLIGTVIIDISSLLHRERDQNISGWFPIYDVNKGIRGEIQIEIRLIFVRDENLAKQISTTLVSFFSTVSPPLHTVRLMLGFVEELVDFKKSEKEDDNMTLIYKGCLKLRKKLGKLVLKRGGNAIISYRQVLDDEGVKSKKFVIRGYGTAVLIAHQDEDEHIGSLNQLKKSYKLPKPQYPIQKISSSKHTEPIHPKKYNFQIQQDEGRQDYEDKSRVQFITSNSFPEDTHMWFGSTVSARSVRLISLKTTERDNWWAELREEITKNALSMNCTHIIGYREIVNIYDDVIVMNVFGTAVKIKEKKRREHLRLHRTKTPADHSPLVDSIPVSRGVSIQNQDVKKLKQTKTEQLRVQTHPSCQFCHVIYSSHGKEKILNKLNLFKCLECDKDYVPEIIIASVDPPEGLSIIGQPKFLEARMVKLKKRARGEQHAISVSEKIFFLEYHLHSLLIQKMKMLSKNAVFSLRINIVVSADTITGIATGTALCLKALPLPTPLNIKKNIQLVHENDEDHNFFINLEILSKFYTEQSMKSDTFVIRSPYYFMQQQKKRQSYQVGPKKSTDNVVEHMQLRRTPSKTIVDDNQINNNIVISDQQLVLSRIDEEQKECIDHNRIMFNKMQSKGEEISVADILTDEESKHEPQFQLQATLDQVLQKIQNENQELKRVSETYVDKKKAPNSLALALALRQKMSIDYDEQNSPGLPPEREPSDKENHRGKFALKQQDLEWDEKVEFYNNNDNFKAYHNQEPSPILQFTHSNMHENFFDLINDNRAIDSVKQPRQQIHQFIGPNTITKTSFVIELDDNKDIDILKSFLDPYLPPNVTLLNTQFDFFNYNWQTVDPDNIIFIAKASRYSFHEREPTMINQSFNYIMQQAYLELVADLISKGLAPCVVIALRNQYTINDENQVDIVFTAAILQTQDHQMINLATLEKEQLRIRTDINLPKALQEAIDEFGNRIGHDQRIDIDLSIGQRPEIQQKQRKRRKFLNFLKCKTVKKQRPFENKFVQQRQHIKLIPMSIYPRKIIKRYLGLVDVHIIRETTRLQENDSVPKIIEQVIDEMQEIAKARAEALGGNCLLGFKVDVNTIDQGLQNQLYLIVSCFGDVVEIVDDSPIQAQPQALLKQMSSAGDMFQIS